MSDESRAEDEADITVYDLAERAGGGVQVSAPAGKEIANELLRVRNVLLDLWEDALGDPGDELARLRRLHRAIGGLLTVMGYP